MTDRPPRVSVVIIFLDAGPFIEEAIESVFAQTYSDWELLLVDDGSTDRSSEVATEYARRFPAQVRYLEHDGHQNRGMSASRNLGIHHGRGEFVAFLDADDVWLPGKLAAQVALLDAQPAAAMAYGPAEWWYSWSGKQKDARRDFVHELGVPPDSLVEPPSLLAAFLADEGISPCTCSMLIRRDVLRAVGGFEDSFRGLYEDQVLSAKISLEHPVYASAECWYRYRQHGGSALAAAGRAGTHHAARRAFLEWLDTYVAERRPHNTVVRAAVARELERLNVEGDAPLRRRSIARRILAWRRWP